MRQHHRWSPGTALSPILLLAMCESAKAAQASDCDVQAEGNGPFRSMGSAHVVISGDGYSIDLPSQPAVCGAWAMQDTSEWGPPIRAGQGFLFQTCVKEGIVAALSKHRSSDIGALEKEGPEQEVFFQHTPAGLPGRTYRSLDGKLLRLEGGLQSATVHASLVEDTSRSKVQLDVSFRCAPLHGQEVAQGQRPLMPTPTPALQPARPAEPTQRPVQGPACRVEYMLGSPADLFTPQKRWFADGTATDVQHCESDILTEVRAQCAHVPAQRNSWVTGQLRLIAETGSVRLMQGFRTTCSRVAAKQPLCFDYPCSGIPEDTPGCQPCPTGQRREVDCKCRYPPGPVQCSARGRTTSGEDWSHQTNTSDFGACVVEAEKAFHRWCKTWFKTKKRASAWADVEVQVWKDEDKYYNVSAYGVGRCSDATHDADFCMRRKDGPNERSCERPCPSGQCLSGATCVQPGGPMTGLCENPDSIFCMACK